MKYLKKFKLFEHLYDYLEDQVKTLEEIFLDVTDLGWRVIIDNNPNMIDSEMQLLYQEYNPKLSVEESVFNIVICLDVEDEDRDDYNPDNEDYYVGKKFPEEEVFECAERAATYLDIDYIISIGTDDDIHNEEKIYDEQAYIRGKGYVKIAFFEKD